MKKGATFIAVLGLLTGGSLVAEHRPLGAQASAAAVMRGLSSLGSAAAVAHRLSCSAHLESPDSETEPLKPLHWEADSYPRDHQKSRGLMTFPLQVYEVLV